MQPINVMCYSGAWTITAVSLTLASLYAPKIFYLGACTFTIVNVVLFDRALLTSNNTQMLSRWMAVSCIVISAVLTTVLARAFLLVPFLLKSRDLGRVFLSAGLIASIVGFSGPPIRSFFRKGLRLFERNEWKELNQFMLIDRSQLYKAWDPIQCAMRFAAINFPSAFQHLDTPSQLQTFIFLPAAEREIQWKKELSSLEEAHAVIESLSNIEEKLRYQLLFLMRCNRCTEKLKMLSPESQIRLFREIIRFQQQFSSLTIELHAEFIKYLDNQKKELRASLDSKIEGFKSEIKTFETNFSAEEFQKLQMEFIEILDKTRLLVPEEAPKLRKFQSEVLVPFHTHLQRKISLTQTEQDPIDDHDTPANFFLSRPGEGYQTLVSLLKAQGVTAGDTFTDLDQKLTKHGIGTMKELIDKALGGDRTLLTNLKAESGGDKYEYVIPPEVFDKLKTYLATTTSLRTRVYSLLSPIEPASFTIGNETFARVAYRVMMLTITVAPLFQDPRLGLYGLIASAFYQIPFIRWMIEEAKDDHALIRKWFSVATRHPLIPQLRMQDSPEVQEYLKRDLFGKLSILGVELIMGSSLLFKIRPLPEYPGLRIGALFQGFALGQEFFHAVR